MYCDYKCSVALPHAAVSWSAVCGIILTCSFSVGQVLRICIPELNSPIPHVLSATDILLSISIDYPISPSGLFQLGI